MPFVADNGVLRYEVCVFVSSKVILHSLLFVVCLSRCSFVLFCNIFYSNIHSIYVTTVARLMVWENAEHDTFISLSLSISIVLP